MWWLLWAACAPHVPRGESVLDAARAGPRVVVQAEPSAPDVYLTAAVRAGTSLDPIGREGLAALTAAALADGGAGARGPEALREALYLAGGAFEVVVDRDQVTLRLRCHREVAEDCVDLFADMLVAPRFEPEVVGRIAEEAAVALREGAGDDEEGLALTALETWLYEGRPYGHPVLGRFGVVGTLDADDARAFWSERYLPGATVLGVAGAVDDALVQRLVARWAAVEDRPYREVPLLRPPSVEGRSLRVIETSSEVVGFRFGHPVAVDRNHPDWPALALAFTAFGAHRQSFGVLFRSLRATRGLNYGTYAYLEPFRERSDAALPEQGVVRRQAYLHVWVRPTSPENAPFALKLAIDELERFARDGLTQAQLDDTRSYLLGALPLQAPDPGRRLAFAVEAAATDTPDLLQALPDRLRALTLDEVNAAIYRHVQPENLRIVAVGGALDAWLPRLLSAEPTPMAPGPVTLDAETLAADAAVAARRLELVDVAVVPAAEAFR